MAGRCRHVCCHTQAGNQRAWFVPPRVDWERQKGSAAGARRAGRPSQRHCLLHIGKAASAACPPAGPGHGAARSSSLRDPRRFAAAVTLPPHIKDRPFHHRLNAVSAIALPPLISNFRRHSRTPYRCVAIRSPCVPHRLCRRPPCRFPDQFLLKVIGVQKRATVQAAFHLKWYLNPSS